MLTCACALQAIPGIAYDRSSGYWKVVGGCANVNSLPPVTFTIGGVGLDLQPQQWTRSVRSQHGLMSEKPNRTLSALGLHDAL